MGTCLADVSVPCSCTVHKCVYMQQLSKTVFTCCLHSVILSTSTSGSIIVMDCFKGWCENIHCCKICRVQKHCTWIVNSYFCRATHVVCGSTALRLLTVVSVLQVCAAALHSWARLQLRASCHAYQCRYLWGNRCSPLTS